MNKCLEDRIQVACVAGVVEAGANVATSRRERLSHHALVERVFLFGSVRRGTVESGRVVGGGRGEGRRFGVDAAESWLVCALRVSKECIASE